MFCKDFKKGETIMTDNLLTPENEDEIQNRKDKAAVPDKFIDPETGEVRLEALVTSYKELERKLSTMVAKPDTDEGRAQILALMGVPATPDDYPVNVEGSPLEIDPEVNRRLHARGFTPEQVQEVYDLAAEKLVPAVLEMAQEFQADREVERLIAAFGGADKWREMSRQLLAFGQKNLPADVLDNLSSSFEGVMALHRMMKGEEPALQNTTTTKISDSENDLKSMMKDPRYWRDRDPAFVAKVTEGFQRLYGEN